MREFVGVTPATPAGHRHAGHQPRAHQCAALTRQVHRELTAAAEEVAHREDIAAVIPFGGHEIFCAGDDVP